MQGRNSGRMIAETIIPGAIKFIKKQPLLDFGTRVMTGFSCPLLFAALRTDFTLRPDATTVRRSCLRAIHFPLCCRSRWDRLMERILRGGMRLELYHRCGGQVYRIRETIRRPSLSRSCMHRAFEVPLPFVPTVAAKRRCSKDLFTDLVCCMLRYLVNVFPARSPEFLVCIRF